MQELDLRLNGKTALVCGSTDGIGRGIASSLVEEGANVMISGRNERKARQVVGAIGSDRVSYYCHDYQDEHAAKEIYEATVRVFGSPDILILNGPGPQPMRAVDIDRESALSAFKGVTLFGIDLVNLAISEMQSKRWGRIVSVGSSGVVEPIQNLALSNISRLSLLGYLKTLSQDVARDGITVNMIVPGRIDTSRVRNIDQHNANIEKVSASEVKQRSLDSIPAGRYGSPSDIGSLVAFICSTNADFITGCARRCDGGLIRSL